MRVPGAVARSRGRSPAPSPRDRPPAPARVPRDRSPAPIWHRILPALLAGVLAAVYVIVSPPSEDLAAQLLRAKLFSSTGFGIWNNWWYGGHNVPGYSVLFPPVAAVLTPQLAAAIAATASAALFDSLVRRRFGDDAWLGSLWFAAATATSLYTGRLTFAFGLLPAVGTALALQRSRPAIATSLAVVTALASPVDALFAALAGGAQAVDAYLEHRRLRPALPGIAVVVGAFAPVLILAVAFPEGGYEPFAFSAFCPIIVICAIAFVALPTRDRALRAGVVLYALGCFAAYAVHTPVGSNAARLAPLLAGPLAALLWFRRRPLALLLAALPLLYIQWQAPVRDVRVAIGTDAVSSAYYQPLIAFLTRQAGPPFRVEIPFTIFHWEAYAVAPRFPSPRGWERQLDIKYNGLFYGKTPLNAVTYDAWLHQLAVRFVAVSDAKLDYSAVKETALIDRGLPYLKLVFRTRHWRVYAVQDPTPIVQGAAALRTLGPNSVSIVARRPGMAYLRVRFSPYWTLPEGAGCVAPNGGFTKVILRRAGPVRLTIQFSLGRIGARSARCG
jgi:peptidoglycan/LPS O-acetylase OafA/YrhL